MKKKLIEILAVSALFETLSKSHFNNFSVAYKIAKATKELATHKDFYVTEEKKIVESYAAKDKNGQVIIMEGNKIKFNTVDDAKKFNSEITNLQSTEVDLFEPIVIKLSDFKDGEMNLTPNDIMVLDGFVVFDDGCDPKVREA